MSVAIIDASALLALLLRESGADIVSQQLDHPTLISTVNYAETLYVLQRRKKELSWDKILQEVNDLQLEIIPLSEHQARLAANVHEMSRPFGLSLADCACLALTMDYRLPVLTADNKWQNLPFKISIDIRLIRKRT